MVSAAATDHDSVRCLCGDFHPGDKGDAHAVSHLEWMTRDLKSRGLLEREPGPIATALEVDLSGADLSVRGRGTLAAMARKLARVIDARGEDEPASQTAKAIETLRITMDKILTRETDDPDTKRRLEELLSTPGDGGSSVPPALRYPPKS